MVFFGAGPGLYALDARDGRQVWGRSFGKLPPGPNDPAEVESSPVVWNGTVYVGMDVHNQRGDETGNNRGGVFALDAATGAIKWEYHSELAARQPASGCGGRMGLADDRRPDRPALLRDRELPGGERQPQAPDGGDHRAPRRGTGSGCGRSGPTSRRGRTAYDDLDEDFGATPNLFRDANGRKVLGAGSKDGSYYALRPRDREGPVEHRA